MAVWRWLVAATMAAGALPALADDSCSLANNGMCEEDYVGPGYCAPATDSSDCAGGYVIPGSDQRQLTADDLRYLSPYALRLARNEIFARHGYRFNSDDLQAFFGLRSWYSPVGQNVTLSAVEQANVTLIQGLEDGSIARAEQQQRPPDGQALPPLTAWRADVVHADGSVEAGIVDGVRGRVTDLATTFTVVVRVDRDDALYYSQDEEYGTVVGWGLFPPVLLEPFVHGLGIVPQPIGREQVLGEKVTRVRLDWEDGYRSLHGEAWLTDDGIFVKVDVEGVYEECCGGDMNVPWQLEYQLENLERGRTDPSLLEPPPFHQWGYAG